MVNSIPQIEFDKDSLVLYREWAKYLSLFSVTQLVVILAYRLKCICLHKVKFNFCDCLWSTQAFSKCSDQIKSIYREIFKWNWEEKTNLWINVRSELKPNGITAWCSQGGTPISFRCHVYPYYSFRRNAANICHIYNYSESNKEAWLRFRLKNKAFAGSALWRVSQVVLLFGIVN